MAKRSELLSELRSRRARSGVALFDRNARPTSAAAKETCCELLSWNMGWANKEEPMTELVTRRIAGVRSVIVFAVSCPR
jgi:hypothetical protein